MTSPFTKVENLIPANASAKLREFMKLVSDPCLNLREDCGNIQAPCCGGDLETVFGTLPLQVKCKSCGQVHLLKDLVKDFQKTV